CQVCEQGARPTEAPGLSVNLCRGTAVGRSLYRTHGLSDTERGVRRGQDQNQELLRLALDLPVRVPKGSTILGCVARLPNHDVRCRGSLPRGSGPLRRTRQVDPVVFWGGDQRGEVPQTSNICDECSCSH